MQLRRLRQMEMHWELLVVDVAGDAREIHLLQLGQALVRAHDSLRSFILPGDVEFAERRSIVCRSLVHGFAYTDQPCNIRVGSPVTSLATRRQARVILRNRSGVE